MNPAIADNRPVLLGEPVGNVVVDHLDVDELVDVELVVQVIEFINPGICGSCIL